MTSKSSKLIAIILLVLVGAAASFGYVTQSSFLKKSSDTAEKTEATKFDPSALAVRPDDLILGDANALVTVVEYASLSCTHCAHFHENTLPVIQKEFITPGKVRLVFRHFPLNDPALKGAELVECAGQNGLQRTNFVKVLFDMQSTWAFDEHFVENLKKIAGVGGIDSATFDSCMTDKNLETKILSGRQEAQVKLGVDSTPTLFINGERYDGDRGPDALRKALVNALSPKK